MSRRSRKTIKTLTAVAKQRAMDLEVAKTEALRARTIKENAENSLRKIKFDIDGLEGLLRESLTTSETFSVQELMIQRTYLSERQVELENVKNKYYLAEKFNDKMVDEVRAKNQKLEIVNRIKENKIFEEKQSSLRTAGAEIDEVCAQKGIRK